MGLKRDNIPVSSSKIRYRVKHLHMVFSILCTHLDREDVFYRILCVVKGSFIAGVQTFSGRSNGPMSGIPGICKTLHLEVYPRKHGGSRCFGGKETVALRQQRFCCGKVI